MLITLSGRKWIKRYYRYNNHGFREDKDFTQFKPKETYRIGILGDSFVEGQGIEDLDDRFSGILQEHITNKLNVSCEVYNMGKGDSDTIDEKKYLLERGTLFQLDALILSVLEIDDFLSIASITESFDEHLDIRNRQGSIARIIECFTKNSYAFSFFYAQFIKLREHFLLKKEFINLAESAISDGRNWKEFISHIQDIKEICDSNGIKFYIVSFPIIHLDKNKEFGRLEREYRKQLARYLLDAGIRHIFLDKSFSKYDCKDLIVSRFDIHPNELANEIVADKLLLLMQEQLRK